MVKIQFTLPNGEEHVYELTEQHYSIGRVDGNDIHLEHSSVSSKHAELVWNGETYELHDLDSTNGTKVNGNTIDRQALYANNTLELGEVLGLYSGDSEAAAALEQPQEEAMVETPAVDPWAEPASEPVRPAARSKKGAASAKVSGFGPKIKISDPLAKVATALGLLAILVCLGAIAMTSQMAVN